MLNRIKKSIPITVCLISFSAYGSSWDAIKNCQLSNSQSTGLYPEAARKLSDLGLTPRITQELNQSVSPQNVHGVDDVIDKVAYTAAVDISVRCLAADQDGTIKELLKTLAENGFVGWYRKNGIDGWSGPNHIHAIWVKQKLKPSLVKQVNSWLEGRSGLRSNEVYEYWKPADELKNMVRDYLKYPL
jgi:hypothetical protein